MKPRDRRWNNVPLEKLLEDAKKIDSRTVWGGDPITYSNLNSVYWQQHLYCYGRLP